ncbi:hypothetical protein, partial [Emergencia timonensis]|uniref:hypothetical protein n=1 Tax=Emergencia timonensis TaxID=1776384 RepID=UPI003516BCB0
GVSRKSTLAVVIAKLGHKEIGIFDSIICDFFIRRQQAAGVSRKSTLAVVIAKLGHKEIGIFDSVISDFLTILLRFLNFVNFRRFLFLSYAILRWYLKKGERKC